MNSKKSVNPKQWETAIRSARQYVNNYAKVRWKIVDICLSVCDYSHGGRKAKTAWSVKRFAGEINLEPKTLYEWVRIKRVVFDKLPGKIRDKAHKYKYDDFCKAGESLTPESTNKEVYSAFLSVLDMPPEQRKLEKYMSVVDTLIYNASRPMLMKDIPDDMVQGYVKKLTLARNLMEKELELRERFKDQEQLTKKRIGLKIHDMNKDLGFE